MDKLLKILEEIKSGEKTPQEAHDRIVDDILRNNLSPMLNFVALVDADLDRTKFETPNAYQMQIRMQIGQVKKSINFLVDK